jgi:hypothetical protein
LKATFTLNGVRVEKNLTTSWEETTFATFLALYECGNDRVKILSVLTGIDEETLRKSEIGNLEPLLRLISYVTNQPFEYEIPEAIHVGDHSYPIAKNLEITSLDRYNDLEDIIKTFATLDTKGVVSKYPLICAIYAVNPYDYKDAENLSKEFFNAPCTEVMAVGNFTQVNISGLKNIIPQTAHKGGLLPNKSRRGLKSYIKSLVYMARYYSWKRTLPSPVRRYIDGQ